MRGVPEFCFWIEISGKGFCLTVNYFMSYASPESIILLSLFFFFRKSLLYPCVGFRYLLYGTFNGISFSSLYRGITHFFISNLHKEVKLISMSVKLHSTQEHFDGV